MPPYTGLLNSLNIAPILPTLNSDILLVEQGGEHFFVPIEDLKFVNAGQLLGRNSENPGKWEEISPTNSVNIVDFDIKLVNDQENPGKNKYYGTNEESKKGFHPLSNCFGNIGEFIETDVNCVDEILYVTRTPISFSYENNCLKVQRGTPDTTIEGCCKCDTPPPSNTVNNQNCCGCVAVPRQYSVTVNGFISESIGCSGNCKDLNGTFILTLSVNTCTWNSSDSSPCNPGDPSFQLYCDGVDWILYTTAIAGSTLINWKLPVAQWNCLGNNTLTLNSAGFCTGGYPNQLTLIPI